MPDCPRFRGWFSGGQLVGADEAGLTELLDDVQVRLDHLSSACLEASTGCMTALDGAGPPPARPRR